MKSFKKFLSSYLIITVLAIGMGTAHAGLSSSEFIEIEKTDRAQDLQKIQKVLEIKMVKSRLEQLGFTQEEVRLRLESLSDQQLHQMASKLDNMKAGGSIVGVDSSFFLILLAILVVIGVIIALVGMSTHAIFKSSSPEKETAKLAINSPALE